MRRKTKLILIVIVLVIFSGLWLQSTAWFRLKLAEHYKNTGQKRKVVQMYEKVLRKDKITDNLSIDRRYKLNKYLADYYYRIDDGERAISHYKILQELSPNKKEDYFLFYYLTGDIENLAEFILSYNKKQIREKLPDDFLSSSRFEFYKAKKLAKQGKWEESEVILERLVRKYPYLNIFKSSIEDIANRKVFNQDFPIIGMWQCHGEKGNILKDLSGWGNHGKIQGAKWVKGIKGFALKFNSRQSDFVDIPEINFGNKFSIVFWMKIDDFKKSKHPQFLGAESVFSIGTNKKMLIQAIIGNGKSWRGGWIKSKKDVLKEDVWCFIALTYNGSQLNIYVDGKKVAFSQIDIDSLNTAFYMGWRKGQNKNYAFNGTLDEVFIFDKALANREIQGLLNYYRN